jgi:hypothetical protein
MNHEKVNRSQRENVDFKLSERFPATHRQYQELLELSKTGPQQSSHGSNQCG